VGKLLFFIAAKIPIRGVARQAPKVYRIGPWLRGLANEKAASGELKPLAEPLNLGTIDAAQVALPQSPILRRSGGLSYWQADADKPKNQ